MQTAGRLGRKPSENAVFITCVEKKNALRGISLSHLLIFTINDNFLPAKRAEREETNLVKTIFNSGGCVRKGLFESFSVKNPAGNFQQF